MSDQKTQFPLFLDLYTALYLRISLLDNAPNYLPSWVRYPKRELRMTTYFFCYKKQLS